MLQLLKPGHVLSFGTCPSTIMSPKAVGSASNDNTLETSWPTTRALGQVRALSHPSGPAGPVAADVAMNLRTTPSSASRGASYSAVGRAVTSSDRPVGSEMCDFVGYVDGQSNYIDSALSVFSKDFSGCLMVVYSVGGQRRVAHVAASQVAKMDCKQAFLDTIRANGATLIGWFRPYVQSRDVDDKIKAFNRVKAHVPRQQVDNLTTFGVMTSTNRGYSVDAFRSAASPGNIWIVTKVVERTLSTNWRFS